MNEPNRATPQAWQDVARAVEAHLGRPPSALEPVQLALRLGLKIEPSADEVARLGDAAIQIPPHLDPEDFPLAVARGVAHWLLRSRGFERTEDAVQGLADLLTTPRALLQGPAKVIDLASAARRLR